jgi:integral membrane protein
MTTGGQPPRPKYARSLLVYRVFAFATGVVLILATIGLILQVTVAESAKTEIGIIWVFHGYLYLSYLLATANLGLKMRWGLFKIALIAAAGTIPTMSFVAEHFVTREVRTKTAVPEPAAIDSHTGRP